MVKVEDYEVPENLYYHKEYLWAKVEDGKVKIGISDFAQKQLNDIVYVEFPSVGDTITQNEPCGTLESVKAVSDLIAPISGTVESVNEELEAKPDLVNEITAEVIRIIREKNPTRIIMADSYFWAASDYLRQLKLPADDPNVVGHFHMYQPILFTHQSAPWMDPWYHTPGVISPGPPPTPIEPNAAAQGQPWVMDFFRDYNTKSMETNPSGPTTVFAHFDTVARWVKETGKRAYLGEFGAIDFADAQSRENYVWLVRTEAERRGIGWCYWDDGGRFKAMDTRAGTWNEELRRALLE